MAINYDDLSVEELQVLKEQLTQKVGQDEARIIKPGGAVDKTADQVLAVQAGLTDNLIGTGQDIVSAGRRFITDPLGITDEKRSQQREVELDKARKTKASEYQRAGLGTAYKAGGLLGTLGTLVAPGGVLAKGSKALVKGSTLAAKGARLAASEAPLGLAYGAIKSKGTAGERIKEGSKEALTFTAFGAAGKAAGSIFKRIPVKEETVKIFNKLGITPRVSQVVKNNKVQKVVQKIEDLFERIPGGGIKGSKAGQIDKIDDVARDLQSLAQSTIRQQDDISKGFNTFFAKYNNTFKDTKLPKLVQAVKNRLERNGNTTALGQLNKKFSDVDLMALQNGTMSAKRLHEVRRNIDDVIETLQAGTAVGSNTKAGFRELVKIRSALENRIEGFAKSQGVVKDYKALKEMQQEVIDARTINTILNKSFKKGEFNRTTFQNEVFNASNRKIFTGMNNAEVRKLTSTLDDVIKVVGTKPAPKAGIRLPDIGTVGGALGVTGATLATLGTGAAVGVGTVILGLGRLMSSKVGLKLLTRVGKSPGHIEKIAAIAARMGAAQTVDENPKLSQSDFDSMSVEELQKLRDQLTNKLGKSNGE